MKKRKLKPAVKNTLIICGCVLVFAVIVKGLFSNSGVTFEDEFVYVNDYIFDNYYPVVNQEEKLLKPYSSDKVTISKYYYEKDDTEDKQQQSIIYYDGIYMPNSGIEYLSEESFDVLASLSGTVINVSNDALLGNTIEVKSSNEITILYQSLNNVAVKKGDTISQGQIIATSGKNSLSKIENNLHFEIYKSGSLINPEKVFDKSLKEIANN